MKILQLTKDKVAFVDDEDYERVSRYKWHASRPKKTWYAVRNVREKGRTHAIYLHRAILQAQPGQEIDHRNGNGLDCRRANLRLASRDQNSYNVSRRTAASGFKGVYADKGRGNWRAGIKHRGQSIYLGAFADAEDAAKAYDVKAIELFGEFAWLNFPPKEHVQHENK